VQQVDLFQTDPTPPRPPRPSRREQARAARDRGIKTAADHTNAVHANWTDAAYALAVVYLNGLAPGAFVRTEQIREYAEGRGLPNPPDKRSWGYIPIKARNAGLVRSNGFTTAADPKVHCNPVTQWVKTS
jgi:hypothetical protein